jgi:hypothetical protein
MAMPTRRSCELGRLARVDADGRQRRDEAARVEHALHDRQHVRVDRDLLEPRSVDQQVVDPDGVGALEVVPRRRDGELALEPEQVVVQRVDELGVDGVLDDRVAVRGDALDVVVDVDAGGLGAGHVVPPEPHGNGPPSTDGLLPAPG